MSACTLYLRVDDAAGDGYPVRLGLVDVDQPGVVSLEHAGALPVAMPPAPAAGSMGTYLHGLMATAGGARLAELLHAAGLGSVTVDVRPAHLAALPWETMDPGPGHRYLFVDDERPWSRGSWETTGLSIRTLGPLRLLVVVCDPQDESLRAEEELDGIHRAVSRSLGRIHLDVIDSPPDWAALRQKLTDLLPQVVHFIGHTRKTERQSVLEFTPASSRRTWDLAADVIGNSWPGGARLVVISACRSGERPPTGVDTLTGALKGAGVPAVLGMRGDIASPAAVDFAAEFYRYLADDKSVDAAAAAGRRAIFDRAQAGPDWHYPVLETLVPAAHVLPIRFAVDNWQESPTRRIPEFAKLQRFVDRSEQRRRTWWAIDPEDLPGRHELRGGALITGPRGSGKTWLAQASLLVCYLRGWRLHYVDLEAEKAEGELGESTKDWLETLRAIRDGTPGCHLSPELDARAFATCNARLNWLVKYPPSVAMPTHADEPVDDERQPFVPDSGQVPQRISLIFKDFLSALEKAAEGQHIVLALDGIGGVTEQSWRNHVMPRLIATLAKGVNGVSLMLIVPQDLLPSRIPGPDVETLEHVDVWEFEHAQIARVIREYGVYSQLDAAETGRINAFLGGYERIPPALLGDLEGSLRLLARR